MMRVTRAGKYSAGNIKKRPKKEVSWRDHFSNPGRADMACCKMVTMGVKGIVQANRYCRTM
jgi:hypothetical protein